MMPSVMLQVRIGCCGAQEGTPDQAVVLREGFPEIISPELSLENGTGSLEGKWGS